MAGGVEDISIKLSLESGNFTQQMTAINKEVKNLDRDLKNAGKGVDGFSKSFSGIDSKIQTTTKKIELYNTKLQKQQQEYQRLTQVLDKQKSKLTDLESTLGKGSNEWKEQAELVVKNSQKLNKLSTNINSTKSSLSLLGNELNNSVRDFENLSNKTKSIEERLASVDRQAQLSESEFNKLGSELSQNGQFFQKLGLEIGQLASKIDTNIAKMNAYESEINKLNTEITQNKEVHSRLAAEIQKTETELSQAKSKYGENSNEALQLKSSLLQLKDAFNATDNDIEKQVDELQKYQTELNQTEIEINQMSRTLERLPKEQIGKKLIDSGNQLKNIGQNMNQYITVPTLAAGVGIGKLSYDFDQGLGKVGSLVNKSGSEMKQYKDRIIELSNKSGVGLKQMTESMYQGISAGANLNNVFKLLDTSSKLSIGGFTSQETAIDGLTTAMNSFGISYDNVNNVSDKFILTQNLGKTTVDELASSIGQVAPTAHAAGVSFDELMSGVAALTKNGIATSESMTAMKAALSNIIKPSGEAQKIAKSLGLEFNTTALKSKGLAGFLEDVKQKTGGNIDTMGKLFGSTEALNAMLLLTGSGAKDFNGALSEMEKSAGLTDKAFKNMKESSGAKLLDSINKLKNSLIGLGDVLAPAIGFVADKISELSGWFGHLSDDGKIAVVAIAGIAAAIGPVLTGIGSLLTIGGNATIMFSALGVSASAVGAVLGGGFIAALALVVEKLGNSTSALQSLQDNFGAFGTAVGAVLEVLSGGIELTFGNMLIFLEQVGKGMMAFIKGDWGSIPNIVDETTAKLHANGAKALNNLTATTTRAIQILKQSTADGMKGVKDTFDLALKELPKLSEDNIGKISNEFSNGLSKLDADSITILKGTSESMNLLFNGIYEGMSKGEAKEKFKQNLTDMLQSGQFTTSELQNDIKQAMDTINHNIADGSSTIKQSGTDMFNAFKESAKFGVEGAASEVSSKLSGMNQETLNQLTSFGSTWKQAFDGIKLDGSMSSQQMKDKIIENIKGMGLTTEQLISQLRNESSQHWANMANDAQNAGNKAKVAFEQIPKEVVTTLKNNGLESNEQITTLYNSLIQLPPEVQTLIKANNYEALQGTTSVQQVLQNLSPEKVIDIITKMSKDTNSDPKVIKQMIDSLPKEKRTKVIAEVGDALKNIESVQNKKVDGKKVKVSEEGSSRVKNDLDKINRTKMTPKNTKVSETGSGVVNAILGRINSTQMKGKNTKVTEHGATNVKNQLDGVNSRAKSKTVTITTVFKTIGHALMGAANWVTRRTSIGGQTKPNKVNKEIFQRLSVATSQSPVPIPTGASTANSTVSTNGESVVPQGFSTGVSNSAEMDINKIIPSFNFNIDMLKDMENQLKNISNQLSIIDNKTKNAFGNEKINLLNRQVNLLKKQQSVQHELAESMRKQQNEIKYQMLGFGFQFNGDKVLNDVELLLKANRTVDDLDRRVKKDTEGKNQALRNEYDKAKNALDKSKELLNEYANLTFDKIPACSKEWWNLNDKINEVNKSIVEVQREINNLKFEVKDDALKDTLTNIQSQLSLLDKQIANNYGGDVQSLINKKISLLQKEQEETHNLAESYREQARIQAEILNNQGFIFDGNGQITNRNILEQYIGTGLFERLNKQINEYNNLINDKIPKLSVEWWNLEEEINHSTNEVKEKYKHQLEKQLNITKKIQDEISNIYKKDIEERKKLIDSEAKHKIDAINKEKNAYNKSRQEIDYKNDIEEQKQEIRELQILIDSVSRDTSITGQHKLQKLNKQMSVLQKKLQDTVQQEIDRQVNESYDNEADRVKAQSDRFIEALESKFDDKNIANLVNQSLSSGIFTDIDGNVKNLKDKLNQFFLESNDSFSVLGATIQKELNNNLQIALESMKNLKGIYSGLGVDFSSVSRFGRQGNIDSTNKQNVTIQYNQPLVVANSVTKESLPDLDKMIRQAEKRITENIVKTIR